MQEHDRKFWKLRNIKYIFNIEYIQIYSTYTNHRIIVLLIIDYNFMEGWKVQRGFRQIIFDEYFYGIYSIIYAEFIFDKKIALSRNKLQSINLISMTKIVVKKPVSWKWKNYARFVGYWW